MYCRASAVFVRTGVCGFWHYPRIARGAGSKHLSGVHLSVRLSVPARLTAANVAAVARPAGDIDCLLHGAQQLRGVRRSNAGSATLSAYVVAEHIVVEWLF